MTDAKDLEARPVPGQPVLSASHVTKQFKVAGGQITAVDDVSVEFHAGKVLAAIQAHADDIPLICGGAVCKLLAEGYTGYLIQTTNDERCGPSASPGETNRKRSAASVCQRNRTGLRESSWETRPAETARPRSLVSALLLPGTVG